MKCDVEKKFFTSILGVRGFIFQCYAHRFHIYVYRPRKHVMSNTHYNFIIWIQFWSRWEIQTVLIFPTRKPITKLTYRTIMQAFQKPDRILFVSKHRGTDFLSLRIITECNAAQNYSYSPSNPKLWLEFTIQNDCLLVFRRIEGFCYYTEASIFLTWKVFHQSCFARIVHTQKHHFWFATK